MVVGDESGGEGGGENFIWVQLLCCVVDVDTEVTESEIEVAVGVKVGERKDMIFGERRLRREDRSGFVDGYFHFLPVVMIGEWLLVFRLYES